MISCTWEIPDLNEYGTKTLNKWLLCLSTGRQTMPVFASYVFPDKKRHICIGGLKDGYAII